MPTCLLVIKNLANQNDAWSDQISFQFFLRRQALIGSLFIINFVILYNEVSVVLREKQFSVQKMYNIPWTNWEQSRK